MTAHLPPPHDVVAHVYVDLDGTGRCVCGRARWTGVHVYNDGSRVPDLGGLVEALRTIRDACDDGIDEILGHPPEPGCDPPLTPAHLRRIAAILDPQENPEDVR